MQSRGILISPFVAHAAADASQDDDSNDEQETVQLRGEWVHSVVFTIITVLGAAIARVAACSCGAAPEAITGGRAVGTDMLQLHQTFVACSWILEGC